MSKGTSYQSILDTVKSYKVDLKETFHIINYDATTGRLGLSITRFIH